MPIVEMKQGAKFNFLDQGELKSALSDHTASWFREMARGLKHMLLPVQLGAVGDAAVSIPAAGGEAVGPRPGFAWAVQRIAVQGLVTAGGVSDVIGIYRNTADPMNYVAQVDASSPFIHFGGRGFILKEGDRLVFANIGTLETTSQIVVTGEFIECAEIDIWKLIGGI